jgi:hypothetical protein
MSKIYSPKIVTDSLVMCLDASQNKSYPTDLPVKNGLVMWMDAADDTTFSYSSGTTVSQWRDKSGFNYHMVPAAPLSTGPSRSSSLNSRKVLTFTTGQSIGSLSFTMETSANTVFVVSRYTSSSLNTNRVLTAYYNNWLLGHWGSQFNKYYAEGWVYGATDPADTVWRMYMGDWSGSSTDLANFYSNGTALATGSSAASAGPRGLGINYQSGEPSSCEAAEIIVFNRVLTTPERRLIHTYLGQKWGISNTDRSIVDLSGNDDNGLLGNGTVSNMPAFDYYNKGSFNFDGSNDYISIPSSTSIKNNTTLSLEAWVYITNTTSYYAGIIGKGTSDTDEEYCLLINSVNSKVYMDIGAGGGPYTDVSYSFSPNIWYHIVGTHLRTSGSSALNIYVNGSLLSGSTVNPTNTVNDNSTAVSIGSRYSNGTSPWNGKIANVKIYTKTLSAAEVLQNYQAQKSKFDNTIVQQGLVLNLDATNPYSYAGAGTTWYDVSGAVNDFTVVNSPTYSAGEFILNGSTQYFSISTGSGFFISSTNNFYADVGYAWSISIWFKFPVSPATLRDVTINGGNCSYCIFGNGGGIGGAETLALFVSGVSGTSAGFHPYYCVVGVRGSKTQLSAGSVNTNTWNHVVVTWNGSAGRGYFNGVDKGALNIGANAMQVSGYTVGATAGGASSHVFEGSLSQVFVYNRAISATEVLQNYNATKGRFGL